MNHLLRGHAPISDLVWSQLDDEARERLTGPLAARRVVDFAGPKGWQHSATNLGRVEEISGPNGEAVSGRRRRVLPLVELRADFALSRRELEDADRGAVDVDYGPLDDAARQIALAENVAVFHGWKKAAISGIAELSPIDPGPLSKDVEEYPRCVARAVEAIRAGGVEGPFALALGPEEHTRVIETAEHGGYPLLDHLGKILEGPIVWAPGLKGGVVVSLRGGDFLFESGQDLAIGYESHDAESVNLYIEESFSFQVATPEAAAPLVNE